MKFNKILFPLFIAVVLVQLFVPAKMIFDKENILTNGKEYKFKVEPIDPMDPFRGKYITLNFAERTFPVKNVEDWERGEQIYVLLTEESGYAAITAISKEKPSGVEDFVKAKIGYVRKYSNSVDIRFPFHRYYMEESKALDAERITRRRMIRDSLQNVYAVIRVIDGAGVLQGVMVNDQRIEDLVKEQQKADKHLSE